MAADDLVMEGARASASKVLTLFSQYTLVQHHKGWQCRKLHCGVWALAMESCFIAITRLTHCGLWCRILTQIWVNISSGHGLFPDNAKPLPETMLTNHQWSFGIHLRTISQEMPKISILDMSLKITNWRLQSHFPWARELTYDWLLYV